MNAAQNEQTPAPETGSVIREVTHAVAFSLSVNLSDKHAITMQTHTAADATNKNDVVDELTSIADRLIARYSLKAMRKNLTLQETQLKNLIANIGRIDAAHRTAYDATGKRGEFKLSKHQQQERDNAIETRKRFEELIDATKKEIAETEKEAS